MQEADNSVRLYPTSTPFSTFGIKVDDNHTLHVEQHGNPDGKPILFLHGGPGSGIGAEQARYFDPNKWNIILFDQRGCGKSHPFTSLKNNTTWDLVSDIEKIREYLTIGSWTVFGGSWGSTLALAYAQLHTVRCRELVLRGIFLGRKQDVEWLYQTGAGRLSPDAWEKFLEPISPEKRSDMVSAYSELFNSDCPNTQIEAAKAWSTWEGQISQLVPNTKFVEKFGEDDFAISMAKIECHYFMNDCFFETDNFLLENMNKLSDTPGYIVHGRYDLVCPAEQAWALHKSWKNSKLQFIDAAGHSLSEPGIARALMEITDQL